MNIVLATAQSLVDASTVLAAEPTLDPIKNLVLKLLGSAFVAFLAWRLFKFWATTNVAMIVAEIGLAIVVSFFVITPDTALATLATLRQQVFPA